MRWLVFLIATVLPAAAFAAPRSVTCGDPKSIGTKIPTLETAMTSGHDHWNLAAARKACVIIGWTNSELVASWDDGATFSKVPGGAIQSAAVGETGTIFIARADGALDVIHGDGTTVSRTVVADNAALTVRGKWLWLQSRVVGDNTQLLSDDDGATWHKLEWTQTNMDVLDLAILDDNTVVAKGRLNDCDHFGCGGRELYKTFEAKLDDGKWHTATAAHAKKLPGDAAVDRHGMTITRDLDSHYIVRVVGTTLRALYTIRKVDR